MGSWMAMSLPGSLRHAKTSHELGRGLVVFVEIAAATRCKKAHRIAGVARFEVLQAFGELGLEGLQAIDLAARRRELLPVDLAHLRHRARRGRRCLPLAHDG